MDWRAEIDPVFLAVLPSGRSIGDLRLEELPVLYDERRMAREHPPRPDIERTDVVINDVSGVGVRVHRAKAAAAPMGCVMTVHGGSFIAGSNRMDTPLVEDWCAELGCVGVAVDYRLAPECAYPGPLDDCVDALGWIHRHADEFGVDPARVGVYGVSAGGALAAGLVLMVRDQGGPPVAFQLLESPCLDDRQITPSSRWEVPVADRSTIELGWRAYLGDLYDADDVPAYAAPARADRHADTPATLVTVGAVDGLRDEGVEYAQQIASTGGNATVLVYPGAPHRFSNLAPNASVSIQHRHDQREWLRRHLTSPSG